MSLSRDPPAWVWGFLLTYMYPPPPPPLTASQGIDFVPTRSWQAHGAAINGMLTCEHHMVTVSDDGYVLVSGLWKFAPVKRFDMTAACIEEGLLTTRSSVRRRLKSAGYFAPQVLYCRLASHALCRPTTIIRLVSRPSHIACD